MTLTFQHAGQKRTLAKHPAVVAALAAGTLTEARARHRPWYLRLQVRGRREVFRLPASNPDAIRAAKDLLRIHVQDPGTFGQWLQDREAARSITIGTIAEAWAAAGYPTDDGRPRTAAAARRHAQMLGYALPWWRDHPAPAITQARLLEYSSHRRNQVTRGSGDRTTDLELSTLSSMCQWAVATERLARNPFANRPRFRATTGIVHCHEAMPGSDEEWHRILGWLFTHDEPELVHAGAWLAWCGLTGLRPGEPGSLLRVPDLTNPPMHLRDLLPGTVFTARDGRHMMRVARLKHGQHPFVHIHEAAGAFLSAWRAWCPVSHYLFPRPTAPDLPLCPPTDHTLLNRALARACRACRLTTMRPHGFGRAWYVRVRRSMGAADSTIGGELGQTTNGAVIRATYGDPHDMMGGALFDWLPEMDGHPADPAWSVWTQSAAPSNVIALAP